MHYFPCNRFCTLTPCKFFIRTFVAAPKFLFVQHVLVKRVPMQEFPTQKVISFEVTIRKPSNS